MKFNVSNKIKLAASLLATSLILVPGLASADSAKTDSTKSSTSSSSASSTDQATRLANIINKGNEEIDRRLNNLSGLSAKIVASTKLTASDRTALTTEVSTTISGLTNLKTKLDDATTVSAAATDVANIVSEYRVYALVDPQVHLIKFADDQQVAETNLQSMATKLQARITAEGQAGQSITTLQSELATMTSDVTSAQTISSTIENSVVGLQATDYDSNHAVLEGDNTQLQTARADIQSAYNEAKTIFTALSTTSSSTSN